MSLTVVAVSETGRPGSDQPLPGRQQLSPAPVPAAGVTGKFVTGWLGTLARCGAVVPPSAGQRLPVRAAPLASCWR